MNYVELQEKFPAIDFDLYSDEEKDDIIRRLELTKSNRNKLLKGLKDDKILQDRFPNMNISYLSDNDKQKILDLIKSKNDNTVT